MNRIAKRVVVGVAGTAAAIGCWVAPASAHISTQDTEAPSGSYFTTAFKLPHGCDGSPTTKLALKIPDGVTSVKGQPVAGWTLTTATRQVDPPIQTEGGEITETTDTLTWEAQPGNALPDDELQMYWVTMKLPEGDPGTSVAFPITQTCEQGETAWIEPMVEGQPEPEHPAPAITLTAASGDGHGGAEAEEAATDADAHGEEEAAAADTSDDSDDSSQGLAIAGIVVGGLGLVVGGIALAKASKKDATPAA